MIFYSCIDATMPHSQSIKAYKFFTFPPTCKTHISIESDYTCIPKGLDSKTVSRLMSQTLKREEGGGGGESSCLFS